MGVVDVTANSHNLHLFFSSKNQFHGSLVKFEMTRQVYRWPCRKPWHSQSPE